MEGWGGVPGVNNKAQQTTECEKRVGVNIHTQGPIGWRRFRSVKVVRVVGNIYIQCMVAFVPHGDEFGFLSAGFTNATFSGVFESEAVAVSPLQPTPS